MSDVTRILQAIDAGQSDAVDDLFSVVYNELRKIAAHKITHEKSGQTLDATGLVHEAYLRLVGEQRFENRRHFFAAAAEAMRRILVEAARRKKRRKRGGALKRHDLARIDVAAVGNVEPIDLLALHEALERFAARSPRKAELVKLRYFAGCSLPEAAKLLGISTSTAEDDWGYAKAWLLREMSRSDSDDVLRMSKKSGGIALLWRT